MPAAATLLLISPLSQIAHAQTKPDNPTPLAPKTEAKSLVTQLLREGKIMRAGEAKRGMKGYALSVFQGTKVEKFNLEVLGTLERVQGGGDLVMIKILDGPVVTRQSGIIQGMSGSPVYINGKLLGAIAIGFGFPKEPIGGVTPITEMIEGALPDNSPAPAPVKVAAAQAATAPTQFARAIDNQLKTSEKQTFRAPQPFIEGAYQPKEPLQIGGRRVARVAVSSDLRVPDWSGPDVAATMAMRPCTRLVLLSGVSPESLPRWQRLFSPYGLTPMIGGGAMSKTAKMQVFGTPSTKTGVKANLAPGAAIGVQLASGDVDATGVGTVTYRLGNRVLAFGHPMFNLGGVSMPMTTAYVHDIFPAYDISFKLASPISVVGELQQDTNFAIGGTVGRVAQTVPMHISLVDPAKKINRNWNMKLIKDPLFTPQLASNIAQEALTSSLGLDSDKTVNVKFRMRLKNGELINRRNSFYADGPVIQSALTEMLTALSLTQQNPFEKGDIAGVDLAVEIVPQRKTATIRQITADRNRAKAGDKVTITVELQPTGEPDVTITKRFVVPIPDDAPNGLLRVAVGPGDSFWSLRARVGGTPPDPGTLPELLEAYDKVGPTDVLELQASTPDRFLLVDRKKVSDPPPLWSRLVPQTQSSSLRAYNETVDLKQKSEYILSGQQFLVLPVESSRPSDRNEPVAGEADATSAISTFGDGMDDVTTTTTDFGDDGDMSTDWNRFDAPGNYRRVLSKLNLQIPSKGNEPPKVPIVEPKPKNPIAPATPAAPAATPTPTPVPAPTPDPNADSIARPAGRWIQNTAADFGSGNFYGSVVRDDGAIVPGPRQKELVSSAEPVAWSLAVAPDKTIYVGTGYNARILQIRNGVSRVFYQGPEVAITALAVSADGTLYAGASPGGRVYRFTPGGKREVLLQTGETFVHALKLTPQGLLVATGGPRAALYRIDNPATVSANPIAKPLVVLPQTHLNSLDVSGNDIYAGAADDAVLYRIDEIGKATALYQATNPASGQGTITIQSGGQTQVINVTSDGAPAQNAPGIAPVNPLQRRGGITGGNEITSIAADADGVYFGTLSSSSIYRYTEKNGVQEYWKAPMGAIYTLALKDGDLYAGTDGGGVWKLNNASGDVRATRLLDATQPQVLALAFSGNDTFAATANNAAVYQIGAGDGGKGNEYDSDIFDAKRVVKWGSLRTLGDGVAIQTRSGNTTDPDKTWSDWTPLMNGQSIASPPGRYLQYRAILQEGGSLSRIEAIYRAPNNAPKVEWTLPKGGEALSGSKTLTWKGTDPDGDTLRYAVELAAAGAPFERVLDVTPTDAKITLKTDKYADGVYRARVRASDAARNPEDPLTDESVSQPFTIDNTAPVLADLTLTKSGGTTQFSNDAVWKLSARGTDATSALAGAEWRIKPMVEEKKDAAKDKENAKTDAAPAKAATATAVTTTTTVVTTTDADDDEAEATDDTKVDADALAEIAAAKKTRSLWQAIGAADGLFDGKTEELVAVLDSAFAPIPLSSGMEIEVRLRDAAGNQTVKTLKLS